MATTSEDDLRAFFLLFRKLSADPGIFEQANAPGPPHEPALKQNSSFSRSENDSEDIHEEHRTAQETQDPLSILLQCVHLSLIFSVR